MEDLQRDRRIIRRTITKFIKELEEEMEKVHPYIAFLETKSKNLERKTAELEIVDQRVWGEMIAVGTTTEAELEIECDAVEDYKQRISLALNEAQQKILEEYNKRRADSPSRAGSVNGDEENPPFAVANGAASVGRRFELPKVELRKFNGDLTEWLRFWSRFKNIHEDKSINITDKLHYLYMSTVKGCRVYDFVESYPQITENYPKIVEGLQDRFGKPELLIEVYARDLNKLVVQSATPGEKIVLSKLYDKLESRLRALESLCKTVKTNSVLLFTLVESCLPEYTLRAWHRSPYSSMDGKQENPVKSRLDYLLEFLRKEIESEEQMALAKASSDKKPQEKVSKDRVPHKPQQSKPKTKEEVPTAAGLHVGSHSLCIFCEKAHYSDRCGNAKGMTLADKTTIIKNKNCCFSCLRKGHSSNDCKVFLKCMICSEKHCELMCPQLSINKTETKAKSEEPKVSQETLVCSTGVILKTLVVNLVTPKNEYKKVRVLLDDGAQRTYIKKKVAEELGLKKVGTEKIIRSLFLKIKEKVWIVLFTCAVYRCVHLELVRCLSTEDFLDAFSRFCARRGRSNVIYRDNGTNFVGAANLFKKINWEKVENTANRQRIIWKFNPPSAAWWGGFWERLVRTIKDLLKRILGNASLSLDKLSTVLCSIEAYVNGRPLTTITEDSADLSVLTPAHFLQQLPTADVMELDFLNVGDMREYYRIRKTVIDEFKLRFRKEYLSQLVQRGKEMKIRKFVVGEIVLIGDDNKKRWQWPMGRILQFSRKGRSYSCRQGQDLSGHFGASNPAPFFH